MRLLPGVLCRVMMRAVHVFESCVATRVHDGIAVQQAVVPCGTAQHQACCTDLVSPVYSGVSTCLCMALLMHMHEQMGSWTSMHGNGEALQLALGRMRRVCYLAMRCVLCRTVCSACMLLTRHDSCDLAAMSVHVQRLRCAAVELAGAAVLWLACCRGSVELQPLVVADCERHMPAGGIFTCISWTCVALRSALRWLSITHGLSCLSWRAPVTTNCTYIVDLCRVRPTPASPSSGGYGSRLQS